MTKLPASRIIKVSFEIVLPVEASHQEIEDWLEFSFGRRGDLPTANPLSDEEPEAISEIWLTDTSQHRHETVKELGDGRYIVSKFRSSAPSDLPSGSDQIRDMVVKRYEAEKATSASPPSAPTSPKPPTP